MLSKLWKLILSLIKKQKEKEKETPQPSPVEDLDLTKVKWLGQNYNNAEMQKILITASMNSKNLSVSYEGYNWPIHIDKGTKLDAICCLFYEKGSDIVGGKFDWWRKGGQAIKTLENVHNGYNGHTWPTDGSKVWTMIVSVDGKKRSNTISVERK